jgi:hypothetical protein
VDSQTSASVVADLIGLPDWLPKAMLRAAGLVLLATMVVSPSTFQRGLTVYAKRESNAFMNRIEPLLRTMATKPPAPPGVPRKERLDRARP